MDKLREDFPEEFAFLDWLQSLPEEEREQYLSESDPIEGDDDPSVINISPEEFEQWKIKYNLHDAREWIERFNNM